MFVSSKIFISVVAKVKRTLAVKKRKLDDIIIVLVFVPSYIMNFGKYCTAENMTFLKLTANENWQ